MPSGAKKRKAAKKKQEQQQSSSPPQINLKSNNDNNHDSRDQGEKESYDVVASSQGNYDKTGRTEDSEERIEIIDSSHDHDKSSSSTSSSSSSSGSDDDKETGDSVSQVVTTVPIQPLPISADAPFMGSTANVIVENTGLMDSTTPNDQNSENVIEISNNADEIALPKPNDITTEVSLAPDEIRQTPSNATESEVVVSHEEEAPVAPTHGIAQRTSWFSCCGLFDVVTGSSR